MEREQEERVLKRWFIGALGAMVLGPTIKFFAALAYHFGWF